MAEEKKYSDMSAEEQFKAKKKVASRINSRMRKTVDKLGINQREYSKFLGRVQASSTLKTSTRYTQDYVFNVKSGDYKKEFLLFGKEVTHEVEYQLLSTGKEDIENYSMEELERLDKLTKSWSKVRADYIQSEEASTDYSEMEMRRTMTIRHLVTQAMEANSDLWYELLDETGWSGDEARQKSTEEIYKQLVKQRAITLASGNRLNFSLLGNGDEDAHQKYLQFRNARQIQSEMSASDEIQADVQKVHYEKW